MSTTKEDVKRWIQTAKILNKATHIISVCDTFSYEDYPVEANGPQDLKEKHAKYNGPNMQRVNEVIDLSLYDKDGNPIRTKKDNPYEKTVEIIVTEEDRTVLGFLGARERDIYIRGMFITQHIKGNIFKVDDVKIEGSKATITYTQGNN